MRESGTQNVEERHTAMMYRFFDFFDDSLLRFLESLLSLSELLDESAVSTEASLPSTLEDDRFFFFGLCSDLSSGLRSLDRLMGWFTLPLPLDSSRGAFEAELTLVSASLSGVAPDAMEADAAEHVAAAKTVWTRRDVRRVKVERQQR